MPEDIEVIGNNAAMILDTLERSAKDIDELVGALDSMSDLPEDIEQFAEALRELDCDLHRHVKILRKKMKVSFVSSDEHERQA
jgi:hypothetical protein